jgi:DNA-binding PucR family transcriptional regulator
MTDNRFVPPASTLEVLETVPDPVLRRLKQYSGRLATQAVHAMQERLPFFADLEASQRASVQLVVQTAVVNFVEWMRNPQSDVSYTAQAFEVVPQDLRRRIALRQSVEMVRITMEFFEEVVPLLARSEEQLTALTAGILRYSRDLAFATSSIATGARRCRTCTAPGWSPSCRARLRRPTDSSPSCSGPSTTDRWCSGRRRRHWPPRISAPQRRSRG